MTSSHRKLTGFSQLNILLVPMALLLSLVIESLRRLDISAQSYLSPSGTFNSNITEEYIGLLQVMFDIPRVTARKFRWKTDVSIHLKILRFLSEYLDL